MKKEARKHIDLSDIKEKDLEKTSSFTDLMSRSEKRRRKEKIEEISSSENNVDIEDMILEKKRNTKDLTIELEKAKEKYNNEYKNDLNDEIQKEDNLGKTQILELTRQMKFNFENNKEENKIKKRNGISVLNIIGEINLLCIGYYIYLLVFTNYQDNQTNYLICGSTVVLLVLLFGLSVISNKKTSKFFMILNIIAIISFIIFNSYTLIK